MLIDLEGAGLSLNQVGRGDLLVTSLPFILSKRFGLATGLSMWVVLTQSAAPDAIRLCLPRLGTLHQITTEGCVVMPPKYEKYQ